MKNHLLSRRILTLQTVFGVLHGLGIVIFIIYQFNPGLRVPFMIATGVVLIVSLGIHLYVRKLKRQLTDWLKSAVPTDSILEGFQLLSLQHGDAFEPFANDLAFRLAREPEALNDATPDDILVALSTTRGRHGGLALILSIAVMGAIREWLKANANHAEYARVRNSYDKERRRIERAGLSEAYA